ncbi:hypothetical protein BT69DRAFT_267101 [Atractiella rhizophila]|nr:hypothetical protein BT69DRAFT_267101 [Atractiella rhizophila]
MPSIKFAATPPFDGTLEGFYNLQGDVTGPVGLLARSVARRLKDNTVDIQERELTFAKSMWDRRSLFLRNRRRESKYRIAYSGRVAESMKEEVKVADGAGWHRPGRRLRTGVHPDRPLSCRGRQNVARVGMGTSSSKLPSPSSS